MPTIDPEASRRIDEYITKQRSWAVPLLKRLQQLITELEEGDQYMGRKYSTKK